jgi:ACS family hexuronate transporter-like MFS transporter
MYFVRWLPVISLMLVSVISYVDRNTLALLSPTILRETGLNAEQYGFIISAFSVTYMFGNPIWGYIMDRVGIRRGMGAAVSIWTIASASHAFAGGFGSFALARSVLGFGEGATFPGAMRTAIETLPIEKRSRGIAISYSGGSLGALITPIIVTPIAAAWGWRGAFWFTGAIGTLWLLHWAFLSKRTELARRPTLHIIRENDPGAPSWSHARLWGLIFAYAFCSLPLGFILYDAALYLSSVLHKTQVEIGSVLWIPGLGWETGYFFFGWVIDRFTGSGRHMKSLNKLFLLLTVLGLLLAVIPMMSSFALTMILMYFTMFISAGFIIGSLAYANSHYSNVHAGLIAGVGAGSWSALVAIVMPPFGRLFDLHMYQTAFLVASLFPVIGYVAWWWLNREELRSSQPSAADASLPS